MKEEILNIDHHRRLLILKALNRTGTVAGAARLTGYSERQLWRLVHAYGIIRQDDQFIIQSKCTSKCPSSPVT